MSIAVQGTSGLRTIGLWFSGLAALLLLIVAFPPSRKAVLCNPIVFTEGLIANHVVFVPGSEHHIYNRAFLAFAQKNGFATASNEMSLTEGGSDGEMYNSLNSMGCDGSALVWSHNVAHPDEFVVTFHSNPLLGKNKAVAIERAFLAEFGARYTIRPDRDVARERGY